MNFIGFLMLQLIDFWRFLALNIRREATRCAWAVPAATVPTDFQIINVTALSVVGVL